MKPSDIPQFFIRQQNGEYILTFIDDKFVQRDYGVVEDSPIKGSITAIFNFIAKQKTEEQLKIEELKEKNELALSLIRTKLSDEEKIDFIDLFPPFQETHDYVTGDEFSYNGTIYRVLQDHRSSHYRPHEAVSLYVDILNKLTIEEFKQPTGEHDAYMIGDKVLWQGEVYRSIIDNNVWSPTDYPQGWEKENS